MADVTEIPIPETYSAKMKAYVGCCRKPHSRSSMKRGYQKCQRQARYIVDNLNFCTQHAGEYLLHLELSHKQVKS